MHNKRCNINNNNNNLSDFKEHKLILDSFQKTLQRKVSRKKLCFKEMQNMSKIYFYTTAFQFWEKNLKNLRRYFLKICRL